MSLAVLCDFDGTIVTIDTCTLLLQRFAEGDWKVYDEKFEKGEITLEECLRSEFLTVRTSKERILEAIEKAAFLRSGFEELVDYCAKRRFPMMVVSAGLDFVIEHIFERRGLIDRVEICAPKATCTSNGIEFTFPRLRYAGSVNFKDDLVTHYMKQGMKVAYVGDGNGDYYAAKKADFTFAIRNSKLAQLLVKEGVAHRQVGRFEEVVEALTVLVPV